MPIPAAYHEPLLSPRAARSVEAAWTFHAPSNGQSIVLPDGRCDVIVKRNPSTAPVAIITGPATRPFVAPHAAGDVWVGLRLRPGLGAILWGARFAQATDTTLRGAEALAVLPALAPILTQTASVNQTRDALLGLSQLTKAPPCPPVLLDALDAVHLSGGRLRQSTVAQLCGCTPRHLNRLFQRDIGMPAKTYARLVRFHRTLATLNAGLMTLTQTALECGFADHAHMTRDVREFGGFTPSSRPPNLVQPAVFI